MPEEADVASAIDAISSSEQNTPETPDAPAAIESDGQGEPTPEDAEQGYLRHSDYTRKTQELAQQRQEFETQQAETQRIQELAQNAFLNGDEEAAREFLDLIGYEDDAEGDFGDETNPEIAELREQLQEATSFMDEIKSEREQAQLGMHVENEFIRLTGEGWNPENPDHDAILAFGTLNSGEGEPPNVEAGYKAVNEMRERIISDYRNGKYAAAGNTDNLSGSPASAALPENADPETRASAILEAHGY
jgi:hypothetical protein